MNKIGMIVIGCIFGAVLGGGASYVYLNKRYSKVLETEAKTYVDEISDLRSQLHDLKKEKTKELNDAKEVIATEKLKIVDNSDDIIEDVTDEDEEDDHYDAEDIRRGPNNVRFISARDFEDDTDYEKEEIKYFMSDGVISQNDEILEPEEFELVCGTSVLPLLRKDKSLSRWSSGGDNEIYIRNEEHITDYKIRRYHKSYDQYIDSM
jgi:hypothetical protein